MAADQVTGLTRRAWARLALWGAAGLSLLPGCRRGSEQGGPTCYALPPSNLPKPPPGSLLGRWTEVGRIWRELSNHSRLRDEYRTDDLKPKFQALRQEMARALDALPAWPELRLVFEERWDHINMLHYAGVTCYEPMPLQTPQPRATVEEQVSTLEKLVEEGKLTKEAAAKAARVLAKQAEYYVQSEHTTDTKALNKRYNDDALKPSKAAALAGDRLAEMTVDDLGLLAGPPTEEEVPKSVPAGEAAKEGAP